MRRIGPDYHLEARLRSRARRKGWVIRKARVRSLDGGGRGGYMLVNVETDSVLIGDAGFPYSATLADIEQYLKGGRSMAG
jgi:hypothetical protein